MTTDEPVEIVSRDGDILVTHDRYHQGMVRLDTYSDETGEHSVFRMTPAAAREMAQALLREADAIEPRGGGE